MAILFILILMASSNIVMAASNNTNTIASRWKELSGHGEGESDKWQGLLIPLDDDLRRYIVHYGGRAGAIGDLYNTKTSGSKSSEQNFFYDAGLVKGNNYEYSVTDFIYAGSDVVSPAFFGYVAVTTYKGKAALGRRDILVVWRGTVEADEWVNNLRIDLTLASDIFGNETQACVHTGFRTLYTGAASDKGSAKDQVCDAVRRLVDMYQYEELSITVTGFSLGAALATLNAMDIVANGYNKPTTGDPSKAFKVTAFVFASPRVGNITLQEEFNRLRDSGLRLLRITNYRDLVPKLPSYPYVQLGDQELTINDGDSDILSNDQVRDIFSAHNLDVYLHSVAGLQNDPKRPYVNFELDPTTAVHDYVLVNKFLDRLKPEYRIPHYWWEGKNRTEMEQQENGRWKVK